MIKGKVKYNKSRPVSIMFFLFVTVLGFYGMFLWLSGSLPVLFDTGNDADIFPKALSILFAGIGCIATVTTCLTGTVTTRIDKYTLDELDHHKYNNGVLVVHEETAHFYTDNSKMVLMRGYARVEFKTGRDGSEDWKFLYN